MAEQASADDDLKFGEWKQLECGGKLPSARYGHVCAVVGSNVYLFGGSSTNNDVTSYNNDLYVLDLSEEKYQWREIEVKGDIPSPREGPTLSAIDDELFLFGGLDKEGSFTCAEGLFVFKTSSNTWERCDTSGPSPQALSLTTAVTGHRLVTFGGVLNGEAQNKVHVLDTITLQWSEPETNGTPPPVRCDHACSVVGDKMYVGCGSGSESLWYSDLYQLDLSSMEWTAMEVKGSVPIPRDCTTLNTLVNQYLVLFGGFSGSRKSDECFNDLHCIDLTRKIPRWVESSKGNQPYPKPRHGHSTVAYDKQIFVFAGQDLDSEFKDVWMIEAEIPMTGFEPVPVPRARYSTSTPVPTPRKVITPAPLQAVKPRDFDELRTTYVKRINEMFDTLSEKFQQLDSANATLESERSAFDKEKKSHTELYERQQQELKEMFDSHRVQNEQWLEKIRQETDSERRALAQQRAVLDKANTDLSKEQEEFAQKSKKLDAIMKQVQGLTT